ncbi:MAG: endonuclease MutS2 [bacterium]|nr:endonuclease MutS2 [bacterium]
MNLSQQTLTTLEFDKVRHLIGERCISHRARQQVLALSPVSDLHQIETRLRPVIECVSMIAFDSPFGSYSLPDIRRAVLSSQPEGAILSVAELLSIAEILAASRRAQAYFATRVTKYPALSRLMSGLQSFPEIEKNLERSIDPTTEGILDSASPDLRKIRRTVENTRIRIRDHIELILEKLPDSVVQERLITMRGNRYVIPIRENQKRKLEGLVHDQSSSGATLFVEPVATVPLNNELREAEMAEMREIKRVLMRLTAEIGQIAGALADTLEILCQFDGIYAKASFSRDLKATEPIFNDEGQILLRKARHPLLAIRLRGEGFENRIVPMDLTLGVEHNTLILTGPNAGGKTVSLKTVGLLALMALAGLPIPADEKSEIPVFKGIFADIGDAQSIESDLSTFSSHMRNLIDIESHADGHSLVLLDEIGASTDPDEGSALAIALLNSFNSRGCRTIATTHHGALKAVAHATPGMANGSMAFDAETLTPTFQLRTGIPGSSYAFEIAERLGLDLGRIAEARELVSREVRHVESLIIDLDEAYRTHSEAAEKVLRQQGELEALKAEYETRLQAVEERETGLMRHAKLEARQILDDAKALVERTVREIRESQADRKAIKAAHEAIASAQMAVAIPATAPSSAPLGAEGESSLRPGDTVWSRTFEREGLLVSHTGSGRGLVQMDNMKMELSLSDLMLRKAAEAPKDTPRFPRVVSPGIPDVPLELDVHGHTFEQAVDKVDQYLSDAILAHFSQARINHGKGTGVLRRKLGEHLKRHPSIKAIRSAPPEQGDWGVTLVDFF